MNEIIKGLKEKRMKNKKIKRMIWVKSKLKIPDEIMKLDSKDPLLMKFLIKLFKQGGIIEYKDVAKNKMKVEYLTGSKELANQLSELLRKVGINSKIELRFRTHWVVSIIGGQNLLKF